MAKFDKSLPELEPDCADPKTCGLCDCKAIGPDERGVYGCEKTQKDCDKKSSKEEVKHDNSNLPGGVRTCDLPGNRPEDAAGEQYQDWLEAKEGNGKRRINNLIEIYCLDNMFQKGSNFVNSAWRGYSIWCEESIPTGLQF